ncbi:hypothetical protein B0H66DRAFT_165615 [Apodospora peruviana]|uniref:Uncharacterized protein n=1 Tax=Apodospora peruviana TaxID=516989 RepID=A0AAE0IK96_9PEZI|nr:hypothetical protein B0H66DRAFT_165615 [Apodospora peruviana]
MGSGDIHDIRGKETELITPKIRRSRLIRTEAVEMSSNYPFDPEPKCRHPRRPVRYQPRRRELNFECPLTPRKVFWPRDYLVPDIPEARVWTYGYNADVIGGMFQASNKNKCPTAWSKPYLSPREGSQE